MLNAYYKNSFRNPFGRRPWLENVSAASTNTSNQAIKGIIAGSVAGALECLITYPTDFIKTKLQLDSSKKYNGIVDCVRKTIKTNGFLGLYRGLSILLLGSIPRAATRFGTYETIRSLLADNNEQLDTKSKILCGLGAAVLEATVFAIPIETINIKFINYKQNNNTENIGFIKCVRTIIKNEGLSGIYQGVTPTLIKQSFTQIIRFYLLESTKDLYIKQDSENNPRSDRIPKYALGFMGFMGGFIPVLINNPIDVIKTRMQSDKDLKYKNTIHCMKQIWKIERFKGFYKGTLARLLHVCTGVSITFVIYQSVMEWLDTYF